MLLNATHFKYAGSFKLPAIPKPVDALQTFNYGGMGLSVSPDGTQLIVGGHAQRLSAGIVKIPSLNGTAELVHAPQAIPVDTSRIPSPRLGGSLWLKDDKIILSVYGEYDASGSITLSHTSFDLKRGVFGGYSGPRAPVKAGRVAGYMCAIPGNVQKYFGYYTYLTGQSGINIISRTNYGFGAAGFDPALADDNSMMNMEEFISYPSEAQQLADRTQLNDMHWNMTTMVGGMALPFGSESLLYVGRVGTTKPCYGNAQSGCMNTGGNPYSGYHGAPYENRIWAYDVTRLNPTSWKNQPYGSWKLAELNGSIAGAAYCNANKKLYVTEQYGEDPRVRVYDVTFGGGSGPVDPPIPPVDPSVMELPSTLTVTMRVGEAFYTGTIQRD